MSKVSEAVINGCGITLCVMLVILVIGAWGFHSGTKFVRVEAVEHGYAEWVSDKYGETKFKWKWEQVDDK